MRRGSTRGQALDDERQEVTFSLRAAARDRFALLGALVEATDVG